MTPVENLITMVEGSMRIDPAIKKKALEYEINYVYDAKYSSLSENTVERIKQVVETIMRVPYEEYIKPTRKSKMVFCRHLFSYLMTKYTNLSTSEIGAYLKKSHATVLHSRQHIDKCLGGFGYEWEQSVIEKSVKLMES